MKSRPAITAPHEPERRAPSRLDASLLSTSRGGARRSHRTVHGPDVHPILEVRVPHEPALGRGIYAASALPCQETLKRHKRRAPVQGHNARTVSVQFLPGLAIAVCLAGLFGGCYSFSGAREEIRQNQEQEATINREIQKEQDRERELENSTNFPATNGPSK